MRYSIEKTYATFQVTFGQTDVHAVLQASGLAALPDLPNLIPGTTSTWKLFANSTSVDAQYSASYG